MHGVLDGPADVVHDHVGLGEVNRHLRFGLKEGLHAVRISPWLISDLPIRDIRPLVSSRERTRDPFMWPLARSISSSESPPPARSANSPRAMERTWSALDGVVPAYTMNSPVSANMEW